MARRTTASPRRRSPADVATNAYSSDADGDATVLKGNDEIASRAWKNWRATRNHLSKWRKEAAECYDMVAGRQWSTEDEAALKEQLRPVVTFNRTDVVVNSVSGYEINNRQEVAYQPRGVEDTGAVQVMSAAADWVRDSCDAEDEESDSFFDSLVCGLGTIEHRMDYDSDPDGMMCVDRVDPLEMGYDPAAVKRNLLDRRWDIRGKWWDIDVAKTTWPKFMFNVSINVPGDTDDLDEKEPIDREAARRYEDTGIGDQEDRRRGKIFILEFTWFDREEYVTALNLKGELEDITPKAFAKLTAKMERLGLPPMKGVTRTRKVFKRAFVYGPDTINKDDLDAPCREGFHYQFITGKRDRNKNVWYGLVRPMMDPQRWANKFFSQTMHMINANAKGGVVSEEGAMADDAVEVERKIAKPGWHIVMRQGKLEAIKFVPPPQIPSNTFDLMQFAISSGRDVTGVNVELLGLADREQPGVLEHSRKQSAMAILSPFFNSMRHYRKQSGRLTLWFIREHMSDGRLIRIVGPQGEEYVPLTKQPGFIKYDVVVDQSPTSPNGKELIFAILTQIIPMLVKGGAPVPPEVFDYVPNLPAKLAQQLKKAIQPSPEAQATAKKAADVEEAKKVADIAKTEADTTLAEAKAAGELAKIVPVLQAVLPALQLLATAFPMAQPGPPIAPPPMVPEQAPPVLPLAPPMPAPQQM